MLSFVRSLFKEINKNGLGKTLRKLKMFGSAAVYVPYSPEDEIYCTSNERLKILLWRDRTAVTLKKRYQQLINAGVDDTLPRKKSDKVWVLWLQGEEAAPSLVKKCIASMRKNLPDKEIIVLDENNLSHYIDLPEIILEKHKKGIIPNAQYSDIIRAKLLIEYGGLWLDATVFCSASGSDFSSIMEAPFFVYKEISLLRNLPQNIIASSWLISSESNNPILCLTYELLRHYWEDYDYLMDYFIFHLFFAMAAERYPEIWNVVPTYNNQNPHMLQFEFEQSYSEKRWNELMKLSSFHKLNHHIDYKVFQGSFYEYFVQEYMI